MGKGRIEGVGSFLGDRRKNWEGVKVKACARLLQCKWFLPQLSYRGKLLVVNNLVASALWPGGASVVHPGLLLALPSSVYRRRN